MRRTTRSWQTSSPWGTGSDTAQVRVQHACNSSRHRHNRRRPALGTTPPPPPRLWRGPGRVDAGTRRRGPTKLRRRVMHAHRARAAPFCAASWPPLGILFPTPRARARPAPSLFTFYLVQTIENSGRAPPQAAGQHGQGGQIIWLCRHASCRGLRISKRKRERERGTSALQGRMPARRTPPSCARGTPSAHPRLDQGGAARPRHTLGWIKAAAS